MLDLFIQMTWQQWAEACAVVLGLIYILLLFFEDRRCWPPGLVSAMIFAVLFWQRQLPMVALLQAYFAVMAIYGWFHWREHAQRDAPRIRVWPWYTHTLAVAGLLLAAYVAKLLMQYWQLPNAQPYMDALVSCASVLAMYMVTHKLLENWAYWIATDVLAVWLYAQAELWGAAAMFLFYALLGILGWRRWLLRYRAQFCY